MNLPHLIDRPHTNGFYRREEARDSLSLAI